MKIVCHGNPIAKKRPRFRRQGNFVMTYDIQEKEKRAVEKFFCAAYQAAWDHDEKAMVMEVSKLAQANAYIVNFKFYLPVPKSDNIKKRNRKLWGLDLPSSKPDYDNLEKFYLDCANGVLWRDDSMIVEAHTFKFYDETPRVEIEVMPKKEPCLSEKAENIITKFSPLELSCFLKDVKKLNILDYDDVINPHNENLVKISSLLSDFAIKYSTILKKIKDISLQ